MRTKKNLLSRISILILFCSLSHYVFSQTDVTIIYNDQTEQTFQLNFQGKIYFSNAVLLIEEGSGEPAGIEISTIRKVLFNLPVTSDYNTTQDTKNVFIYPNPSRNFINIANSPDEKISILIYSLNGNLILQSNVYADEQIDISYLPAGLYIIKINEHTLKLSKL